MRLSNASLDRLPGQIRRPGYDRARVTPGIVHLGIGAFHRAHQAVVIDDLLAAGATDWGIVGASLRSPDTRDALAPQDCLYTVAVRSGAGTEHRIIGSVLRPKSRKTNPAHSDRAHGRSDHAHRLADDHREGLLPHAADRRTGRSIIPTSFTTSHIRTRRDRRRDSSSRHWRAGAIAGIAPFTVLSCDNLSANGHTVKRIVTQFATLRSRELGQWIEDEVAFPSTMVDRIVPETTDADRAAVSSALGMTDAWPVVTEPFTQWIVEDHFPAGRPDFARAGVQLVSDVTPFEHMKLRLLNASHSALAYLGYLAGYETIAATMTDDRFAAFARSVMEDAAPTLAMPAGTDLAAYSASLLQRFANPALHHRTWQIAMDGSQKLPQRLLGTMQDRLRLGLADRYPRARGRGLDALRHRHATNRDSAIDVRDPLAAELAAIAANAGPVADRLAPALLEVRSIFGELGADPRMRSAVTRALAKLYEVGARQAVQAWRPT